MLLIFKFIPIFLELGVPEEHVDKYASLLTLSWNVFNIYLNDTKYYTLEFLPTFELLTNQILANQSWTELKDIQDYIAIRFHLFWNNL